MGCEPVSPFSLASNLSNLSASRVLQKKGKRSC